MFSSSLLGLAYELLNPASRYSWALWEGTWQKEQQGTRATRASLRPSCPPQALQVTSRLPFGPPSGGVRECAYSLAGRWPDSPRRAALATEPPFRDWALRQGLNNY